LKLGLKNTMFLFLSLNLDLENYYVSVTMFFLFFTWNKTTHFLGIFQIENTQEEQM